MLYILLLKLSIFLLFCIWLNRRNFEAVHDNIDKTDKKEK